MRRRNFLLLSFAGTASLALPSVSCSNKTAAFDKTLSQPAALSRFCDVKTIKDIGIAYREKIPSENSRDQLKDLLLKDIAGKEIKKTSDNDLILTSILNKIKQDFEAGRIIKIKGWILSVTEARQCAFLSFL